ncbi:MAG TPA: hypothetical protein VGF17_26865 [Phytomonospora sp.]
MTDTTCAAPDCTAARWGRKDHCRKHHDRIQRNGTLEPKKPGPTPKPRRVCVLDGCERPHKGYGYCKAHLEAERMAGRLRDNDSGCGFPDCDRPHKANGLCDAHNRQQARGMQLRPIGEYVRQGEACSVEECDQPALSKGLCTGHYARQRDGRPLDGPLLRYKPRDVPCSVEACDRDAEVEGMCATHRRRWLAGAAPGWDQPIPTKAPNGAGHIDPETGYVHITVNGKQLREHRYVCEQQLGRPLLPTETVHHVNGVRHDNRLDGPFVMDERGRLRSGNLEVWSHAQPAGQEIGPKLEWARSMLALYGTPEEQAAYAEHSPLATAQQ